MRKLLNILFVIFFSCIFSQTCFSQNGLTDKGDFLGTSRRSSNGFSNNKYGFLIGGEDAFGYKNDLWKYNPDSNQWTQKNNFPGPARNGAICASLGTKFYYGLGFINALTFPCDFWEYNSDSDIWHQRQNFPGIGRLWAVAFSLKNKVYVGTGASLGPSFNDFWEYNPDSDKWNKKADFPGSKRFNAVGFSYNNKGYIGTGTNESAKYFNDFWEYNPDSNLWTQKSNIGDKGISGAISFLIDSTQYIALGTEGYYNINSYNHHVFYFNSIKDTWNLLTDFDKINREKAISFIIGKKAYFGTGDDPINHYYNDWWEFNPSLVSVAVPEVKRFKNEFKIVPNPNEGKFTIEIDRDEIDKMDAEIVNQLGEVVWKNKISGTTGSNAMEIQTGELYPGIYFIKISGDNYFKVERFLIK